MHLIPKLSKIGRDAFHGSHRVVAPMEPVCVQSCRLAVNMAPLHWLCAPCSNRSIYHGRRAQQAGLLLLLLHVSTCWDRQTDTVPLHRPGSAHYAGSASSRNSAGLELCTVGAGKSETGVNVGDQHIR